MVGLRPVQLNLESLLQHHSSKASILQRSAFFIVQLSHPYMTTGKTMALTRWTFVGKVTSLLFSIIIPQCSLPDGFCWLAPSAASCLLFSLFYQLWSEFSFYLELKSHLESLWLVQPVSIPLGHWPVFGLIVSVAPVQGKEFFYLSQHEENIFWEYMTSFLLSYVYISPIRQWSNVVNIQVLM